MRRGLPAGLAALPAGAWAHSPIPGIGSFYGGMLHPVVVPAQLLALLSAALLIGQHGLKLGGEGTTALLASLAAGLVLAGLTGGADTDTVVLLACAVLALLVVAARRLPRAALWAAGAGVGLVVGLGSNPDGLAGAARWAALAGSWLGTAVILSAVSLLADAARRPWMRVAVRVVASWIGACALLVLALQVAGPRVAPPAATQPASAPTLTVPATR